MNKVKINSVLTEGTGGKASQIGTLPPLPGDSIEDFTSNQSQRLPHPAGSPLSPSHGNDTIPPYIGALLGVTTGVGGTVRDRFVKILGATSDQIFPPIIAASSDTTLPEIRARIATVLPDGLPTLDIEHEQPETQPNNAYGEFCDASVSARLSRLAIAAETIMNRLENYCEFFATNIAHHTLMAASEITGELPPDIGEIRPKRLVDEISQLHAFLAQLSEISQIHESLRVKQMKLHILAEAHDAEYAALTDEEQRLRETLRSNKIGLFNSERNPDSNTYPETGIVEDDAKATKRQILNILTGGNASSETDDRNFETRWEPIDDPKSRPYFLSAEMRVVRERKIRTLSQRLTELDAHITQIGSDSDMAKEAIDDVTSLIVFIGDGLNKVLYPKLQILLDNAKTAFEKHIGIERLLHGSFGDAIAAYCASIGRIAIPEGSNVQSGGQYKLLELLPANFEDPETEQI